MRRKKKKERNRRKKKQMWCPRIQQWRPFLEDSLICSEPSAKIEHRFAKVNSRKQLEKEKPRKTQKSKYQSASWYQTNSGAEAKEIERRRKPTTMQNNRQLKKKKNIRNKRFTLHNKIGS